MGGYVSKHCMQTKKFCSVYFGTLFQYFGTLVSNCEVGFASSLAVLQIWSHNLEYSKQTWEPRLRQWHEIEIFDKNDIAFLSSSSKREEELHWRESYTEIFTWKSLKLVKSFFQNREEIKGLPFSFGITITNLDFLT